MIASMVARFSSTSAKSLDNDRPVPHPGLPRWVHLWNTFTVAFAMALLLIDQKGPFGEAAKWFFCALIFAALKGCLKLLIA